MSEQAAFPRVTFGVIVLNGQPFIRYCLNSLYSFAHEIIVVEGGAHAVRSMSANGHSTDGTLEALRDFRARNDPENKLIVVTAEDEGHPDGFWPGEKDEQSRAYATRATGEYLWQVDVDEFYHPRDVSMLLSLLKEHPEITGASFKQISFWGGFDYCVDGWYLKRVGELCPRLFKWKDGYTYLTHRPPTVVDKSGHNLRDLNWLPAPALGKLGIYLYHYSLLFPKQVTEKCQYYANAEWVKRPDAQSWAAENFAQLNHPFRVHNVPGYPSWLYRFTGTHPPEITRLRQDLEDEQFNIDKRQTADIEHVLSAWWYSYTVFALKILNPIARALSPLKRKLGGLRRQISAAFLWFSHDQNKPGSGKQ